MSVFLTITIRRFVAVLIAAGLTIGIPVLFPGNRGKKTYYISWALTVAGVFLVFTIADFLGKYGIGLGGLAFAVVFAVSMDVLVKHLTKSVSLSSEKKKMILGVSSGLVSGVLILAGTETFMKSLSDLIDSADIVPACIVLVCYGVINLIFQRFI